MAYILAGWDHGRIGTASVEGDDDGSAFVVTQTSGTFAHSDLSGVLGTGLFDDFATTLAAALNTGSSGSGAYSVTFSGSTGYAVSYPGGFSLDFDTATPAHGALMARILGFTSAHPDAVASGSSFRLEAQDVYQSNVTPYFQLSLAREGLERYTRPFERSGQTKRATSVNANGYSIGPRTYEKGVKGKIRFQTLATVFESDAVAAHPFTYEALIEHTRMHAPVALALGPTSAPTTTLVCKLTKGEFDEESRTPVWNDYHALWDLPIDWQYLGAI